MRDENLGVRKPVGGIGATAVGLNLCQLAQRIGGKEAFQLAHVIVHSRFGDAEVASDLLERFASGHAAQDLLMTGSKDDVVDQHDWIIRPAT